MFVLLILVCSISTEPKHRYRLRWNSFNFCKQNRPSLIFYHYDDNGDGKKVKVTLVQQALKLCTGRTAHRGVEVQLPFMTTAPEGGEGSASRSGRSLPRETRGTHCMGGWVGPRAGLEKVRKISPPGTRSPDRPARSQSLYRLSYPTHNEDGSLHILVDHPKGRVAS